MRTPASRCLAALVAALAANPAGAGPAASHVPFDPVDPVALNERAADHVRAGDLAIARLLLGRAARLAPFDSRITGNLRILEAYEAGERGGMPATVPPAPAPPAAKALPAAIAEPPALWPRHPEAK